MRKFIYEEKTIDSRLLNFLQFFLRGKNEKNMRKFIYEEKTIDSRLLNFLQFFLRRKNEKNMRKFIYEENTIDLRLLNFYNFSYEEKIWKKRASYGTTKKRGNYGRSFFIGNDAILWKSHENHCHSFFQIINFFGIILQLIPKIKDSIRISPHLGFMKFSHLAFAIFVVRYSF